MVTENHVIFQNNNYTSLGNKGVEPNTYRKDLSWLHFHNEPRAQERQQVKDQDTNMSIFVAYLTIPSNK